MIHLKEEALDRTVLTAGFGRGFVPVVKQTAKRVNEYFFPRKSSRLWGMVEKIIVEPDRTQVTVWCMRRKDAICMSGNDTDAHKHTNTLS